MTGEKNKREGGRHKRRPSRVIDTILVVVVLLCGILLAGNILKETAQRKKGRGDTEACGSGRSAGRGFEGWGNAKPA